MTEENPYQSPVTSIDPRLFASSAQGVWRDGELLRMTKQAILPGRCTRCNAPTDIRLKRRLAWHPPGWYLLILISIWVYIIVALIIRQTATIQVGYCQMHRSKRRWAIAIGWALILAGIGVTAGSASMRNPNPLFVFGGILLIPIGLIYGIVGSQVVTPKRIDKRYVWLKRVSPDYLAELPDWQDALVPPV